MSANSVGEEMYRVLIVDDHPIVRKGLCALMEQEPDLFVCGEAENVDQASKLVETLNPHLVIVDLSLQDGEGLELIKSLRTGYPDLLIMVLSMHQETVFAERAIRAGARGYVMKLEPPENIITAIRGVLKGDIYVSENLAAGILKNLASGEKTNSSGWKTKRPGTSGLFTGWTRSGYQADCGKAESQCENN